MVDLKEYIVDIPDFPHPGIVFKDITPILNNVTAFQTVIDKIVLYAQQINANVIVAPESRGFWFAPAVAYLAKLRFIPIRKPGKLPRAVNQVSYDLEYGSNQLEIIQGMLQPNDRVLILDDILATGGTALGMCQLVEQEKSVVAGLLFIVNLSFLPGASKLTSYPVKCLVEY